MKEYACGKRYALLANRFRLIGRQNIERLLGTVTALDDGDEPARQIQFAGLPL